METNPNTFARSSPGRSLFGLLILLCDSLRDLTLPLRYGSAISIGVIGDAGISLTVELGVVVSAFFLLTPDLTFQRSIKIHATLATGSHK